MGRIIGTRCRNRAESGVLQHEVPGGLLGISILDVSAIMILWCQ